MQAIHKLEPCPSAAGSQKAESNPRLPSRSQASWCELMALMAVRAPTVNRDLAGAARAGHQRGQFARFDFAIDSQLFSRWERRFTSLAGAIHNFEGAIHNSVHNFWRGMAISPKRSPFPRCNLSVECSRCATCCCPVTSSIETW